MLWNKRKSVANLELEESAPERSGPRVAESDRALTAVGTLIKAYGRFAFDTERAAAARVRELCEEWAQRITLGEPGRDNTPDPEGLDSARRDWAGLLRFFDDQRKHEGEYVARSVGTLRHAVLELARCISGGVGEDQTSDARAERRLDALSRALDQNDLRKVADEAKSVMEDARDAMAQRRKRETRITSDLGAQLRTLREELSFAGDSAGTDPTTGAHNRAAFDQQLEQLLAFGLLLPSRPWLILLEVDNASSLAERFNKSQVEEILRQVSDALSRNFLRKQDFIARYSGDCLALLIVDMTTDQLEAALERSLAGVRKIAMRPTLSRAVPITASAGVTMLRANDSADTWPARARLALHRAQEDGQDRFEVTR